MKWQVVQQGDPWIVAEAYVFDILRSSHFIGKRREDVTRLDRAKIVELAARFEEEFRHATRINSSGMLEVNARILRRWIGHAAMTREGRPNDLR